MNHLSRERRGGSKRFVSRRPATGEAAAATSLVLLLILFPMLLGAAAAQDPGGKPAPAGVAVRACPAVTSAADEKPKSKSKRKSVPLNSASSASACLEAQSDPLDIQEFFQSFVRDQSWRIGDERNADYGWTFYRYLEKDDLLRFTKIDTQTIRVNWTEGKAFVQVSTTELKDGFTRVQVSARIRGYGQNADRFAPPKEWWTLDSNGILEGTLIAALGEHFKSLQ
jgi:hypothetical protein